MHVIEITDPQTLERVMKVLLSIVNTYDERGSIRSLRFGIDPLDNGIKFSIDGSTWTRPYSGIIN